MGHSECEYMLKYVLQILCYGMVCMVRGKTFTGKSFVILSFVSTNK